MIQIIAPELQIEFTGPMTKLIRHPSKSTDDRPFLVIWEVTQACDLACEHCRANALPERHPRELKTEQAESLLDQVASFGRPFPLMVFTGGDPFKRADLCHLIAYARQLGLSAGVSPSATPLLTRESLAALREAGAATISLSLDGSCSAIHDRFRGVVGTFDKTMEGCRLAKELGLKLQINSTVGKHNLSDLVQMAGLVAQLQVMTWSVFFLVPTGRATSDQALSARECEDVLNFLVDISTWIPVKTTEGHHYKRVVLMRKVLQEMQQDHSAALSPLYRELRDAWNEKVKELALETRGSARRTPMHINSAQGFVFVSQFGDVFPSGFLPVRAGNILRESLPSIYRNSPLFQILRDTTRLQGRCGACEFREVCGGSRSRAFACSANYLESDPACAYQPGSFPYRDELQALLASSN